ncbi:zf-HC2 domain-containing protein [candidate division KSB1 bacterium]|nr:zf-HC2 domain-containing protein [candidate division KSB1 bacterium]
MKKCKYQNILVEYLDGSSDPGKEEIEKHLRECPVCSAQIAGLRKTQQLLQNRRRPDPSLELLYQYQTNLEKLFPVKTRFTLFREWMVQSWQNIRDLNPAALRMATAAVLILIGVFIGRLIFYHPATDVLNYRGADLVVIKLQPEDLKLVNDYFVQSEILLLAVKNTSDQGGALPSELILDKKLAQDLLNKTLLIQEKTARLNDESLSVFLNQIEFLLLEISNTDDREIIDVFKQIRQVVNAAGLLYESKNFQQMFREMI